MGVYKIGSMGEEVKKIQERLKALGYYRGPIDGEFGGGTEAAVKAFQKAKRLTVEGIVGATTWKALFQEEISEPSIVGESLDYRSLALTGSFETGRDIPECFTGLGGDFDGQGISVGVLQWNFGQGTLQRLLRDILEKHPRVVKNIFQTNYSIFKEALESDKEELMAFARSIQHPVQHYVYEPWRGMFKALGRTEEFQKIQVKYADKLFRKAVELCADYGLWSERAVTLMFDIQVQNGNISTLTKAQILSELGTLPRDLSREELEVRKMRIVANRRAEASNPKWIEDVRARKLCCANGGGMVHGIHFDLEGQFGIKLEAHRVG
jgi:peptidoglycan hydrolase-like protein with peptidoglycan-binding domain